MDVPVANGGATTKAKRWIFHHRLIFNTFAVTLTVTITVSSSASTSHFFPIIIAAAYKIPILLGGLLLDPHRIGSRVWGTLFGYCKGRVSLSIQESPRCLPSLLVKLAMQQ
ncbi:hypothetical protein Bca101_009650 [Brassica carinata]